MRGPFSGVGDTSQLQISSEVFIYIPQGHWVPRKYHKEIFVIG